MRILPATLAFPRAWLFSHQFTGFTPATNFPARTRSHFPKSFTVSVDLLLSMPFAFHSRVEHISREPGKGFHHFPSLLPLLGPLVLLVSSAFRAVRSGCYCAMLRSEESGGVQSLSCYRGCRRLSREESWRGAVILVLLFRCVSRLSFCLRSCTFSVAAMRSLIH